MPIRENVYPELLSLAVHEFRTPASVVGGYLRMLALDPDPALTPKHRKMIDEAEKSCARIVALIAELSDIGKIDAGAIAMARQPIDVFELAGEVADGVREAEDREVRLTPTGAPQGAQTIGDRRRLGDAFRAVFRAILRELPGPATVVVDRTVRQEGATSSAVLLVADAASVQTAYAADREPFDEKRGGLGLALPLARRVIEAHGGQLWTIRDNTRSESSASAGTALIALPLSESAR
jgi:two-component system cell cycle sensor histidine kinase PleC